MRFKLEIDLGGEQPLTWDEVTQVLSAKAQEIKAGAYLVSSETPRANDGGIVRDLAGNPVGRWQVVDDTPPRVTLAGTERL